MFRQPVVIADQLLIERINGKIQTQSSPDDRDILANKNLFTATLRSKFSQFFIETKIKKIFYISNPKDQLQHKRLKLAV